MVSRLWAVEALPKNKCTRTAICTEGGGGGERGERSRERSLKIGNTSNLGEFDGTEVLEKRRNVKQYCWHTTGGNSAEARTSFLPHRMFLGGFSQDLSPPDGNKKTSCIPHTAWWRDALWLVKNRLLDKVYQAFLFRAVIPPNLRCTGFSGLSDVRPFSHVPLIRHDNMYYFLR